MTTNILSSFLFFSFFFFKKKIKNASVEREKECRPQNEICGLFRSIEQREE
jgi:hypothetical protein